MDSLGAPAADFVHIGRRNNSLSRTGRRLAWAYLAGVSLGIATALGTALGAWFVLPFAGLEAAGLYLAFRYLDRHAGDYERVAIRADSIWVEIVEGRVARSVRLSRYWAQVVCDMDDERVMLRSHGQEIEIGRHLPADARFQLAAEVKRALRECGQGRTG